MRLRPHRRNLVVWSSSAAPAGRPGHPGSPRGARPSRGRRLRWWLRISALLMVLGVLRLARTIRNRREPVSLLAGTLLAMVGYMLPSAGAFLLGVLVLIAALLKGIREQQQRRDSAG
jgi:hypothetical protein